MVNPIALSFTHGISYSHAVVHVIAPHLHAPTLATMATPTGLPGAFWGRVVIPFLVNVVARIAAAGFSMIAYISARIKDRPR